MHRVITLALVAVGLLHIFPLVGVLGAGRLAALYGVDVADPNMLLLLQHRAVLFGLFGALLLYASIKRALQPLAIVAGFVSTVSFIALAFAAGPYNERIATVVWADVAAVATLLVAAVLRARVAKDAT